MRERLRISIEKNAGLEEELDGVREELHKYKASGAVLPEESNKKVMSVESMAISYFIHILYNLNQITY